MCQFFSHQTGRRAARVLAAGACVITCVAAAGPARADRTAHRGRSGSGRPAAIIVVTNRHSGGPGSLRAAIHRSRRHPGRPAIIRFRVAGTIRLTRALPAITTPVQLDGGSAPSYRQTGPPVVGIDCAGHPGLRFAAGSSGARLLSISVTRAKGAGVTLKAPSVTLDGDYIGLTVTAAPAGNHGDGIYLAPTSFNNRIGFNPTGTVGLVANVISGNSGNGITLNGSTGNTIIANRIGTNPQGTAAIGNGQAGLAITGNSDRNRIGGRDFTDPATGQANNPTGTKGTVPPVFVVPAQGNLISGNTGYGIAISGRAYRNQVLDAFVGTKTRGMARLGNGRGGVLIGGRAHANLIGARKPLPVNLISGNSGPGVTLRPHTSGNVVTGNYIGLNRRGRLLPNLGRAVVNRGHGNIIGRNRSR